MIVARVALGTAREGAIVGESSDPERDPAMVRALLERVETWEIKSAVVRVASHTLGRALAARVEVTDTRTWEAELLEMIRIGRHLLDEIAEQSREREGQWIH